MTERIDRLEQARKIFDDIFKELGLYPTNKALAKATEVFGLKDSEEFLLRLGNEEIKAESIAEAVHPEVLPPSADHGGEPGCAGGRP